MSPFLPTFSSQPPPIFSGHFHTIVVCVYVSGTYVLWLIPSPSLRDYEDEGQEQFWKFGLHQIHTKSLLMHRFLALLQIFLISASGVRLENFPV